MKHVKCTTKFALNLPKKCLMKVHKCTLANILKAPEFSILNIHIVYFIKIDKSNKSHSLPMLKKYETRLKIYSMAVSHFPGGLGKSARRNFFTVPPEMHFSPPERGVKCF